MSYSASVASAVASHSRKPEQRPGGPLNPVAVPECGGRVLVVGDNLRARQSMVEVLAAAGHEVVSSASAVEALRIVERGTFDVIITDLQMPGMDGLAFIRTLAERK